MQDIYSIAESQKQELLARERKVASELVRAYGLAYSRIQARVAELTAQIEAAKLHPEISASSFLYERDRLRNLKIEIERELRRFSRLATERVTSEQGLAIETATGDAERLVSASIEETGSTSGLSFGALNSEAAAAIVGFAGDGQPLRLLFDKIAPQMATAISDELVSGVVENAPARVIASRIREKSGIGLARSLLIARQETLRAYRTATLENYKASGVVTRWRWLASLDTRTCIICFLMDGKEFPLAVNLNSHVGCRCSLVPVTAQTPPRKTGIERFQELEPGVQKDLLGSAKYIAYQAGKFQLEDLVGVGYSPQWGTVRYQRSLKDLLA
jgi:SPP1 gp7 family putative phage head morphogenesis protein